MEQDDASSFVFEPSLFLNEAYVVQAYDVPAASLRLRLLALNAASTDHDLTGQVVWNASLLLADWIAENSAALFGGARSARVLELGAGVGLAGLVAAAYARRCVLTDCNDVVLRALRRNVERYAAGECGVPAGCDVTCDKLLWGDHVEEFRERNGIFDLIIGADIVFWPDCQEPLFSTVDALLEHRPECHFVTSYMCRATNFDRKQLLAIAERHHFVCETLPLPPTFTARPGIEQLGEVGEDFGKFFLLSFTRK
eukprot:TRINITY_DN2417_c0_g1_i1.p1 TRINITY_DN2417_c0_g1~~TRINITY_DN2417_c0_g1_i1.p1  ORF type:complete len:267 (+),score=83.56 TRINITY_DN2417_c0_g1_i1:42-803(+)